jgi:DNA-binding response OmpR family regulator
MAKLLLIDDDPDILGLVRFLFETSGHQVSSTLDPRQAFELATTTLPDAIVLDVMMPGISGWEVLERLRADERTRALPVIMLSAIGDSSNRTKGLRLGADDFLPKPFSPEELLARVEALIARRKRLSGQLEGQLRPGTLSEMLQALELARRTGCLEVVSALGDGEVLLAEGNLVGAVFAGLDGEEALLQALALETGSFAYRDEPLPTGTSPRSALQLRPLLLEQAWLDDELRRRAHLLPAERSPLTLLSRPRPPADVDSLPIPAVLETLEQGRIRNLGGLLEARLASSLRTKLALTWLVEQGAVASLDTPVPGSSAAAESSLDLGADLFDQEPQLPEELDGALRDFFQTALFSGHDLDGAEVRVLYAASAWGELAPVVETILPWLRVRDTEVTPAQARPGSFDLRHSVGTLRLQLAPLPAAGEPVLSGPLCGLVVWLDPTLAPAELLAALERSLSAVSPRPSCSLTGPRAAPASGSLPAGWSYQPMPQPSFAALLRGLSQQL